MKPLQIFVLLGAGVLGGALLTTVWQRAHSPRRASAPAPAVAQVETPAAAGDPAQPATTSKEVAPPASLQQEQETPAAPKAAKPSPLPPVRRAAANPRPVRKSPPPANPRPLDLGARVEAARPAPVAQAEAPPAVQAPEPLPIPPLATPPARSEPENATPAPIVIPALVPEPRKVTLNAGILIPVRLVDGLSSERNAPGDTFTATLDRELVAEGLVVAERGARVDGRVVSVAQGGRTRGVSTLSVELTRIHTSDGQMVAVQTDSFERRAEANHGEDALKIGGGAIIGAVIGGIAGGGKGAAIGAGAGGGVGAGDVMLTRKPAKLPSETRINFRLRAPVTLTEKHG
jgi:hypothetical protein